MNSQTSEKRKFKNIFMKKKSYYSIRKIDKIVNDSLSEEDEDLKLDFKIIQNNLKTLPKLFKKKNMDRKTPRFGNKIGYMRPKTMNKGYKNLFRRQPKIPKQNDVSHNFKPIYSDNKPEN
mmetsp:Transcript_7122/g.6316  ORF Transcript_7122/g.6316 Transcript_7122/m.6316 type:complete len:120 (+) Transcript_7122:349-708(+)